MASIARYRSGVVQCVPMPFHTTYPIEVGDLLWKHTDGKVYPASAFTTVIGDQGTAAQNRAAFALRFAGVSMHKAGLQTGETSARLTTNPDAVLVAVTGDWEYDCASTSWVTGDMVGVYNDATDSSDQQVAKVTDVNEAIGTAKVPLNAIGDAQTAIIVDIRSVLMRSGISGQ